jgi:hypothetical protein
MGSKQSLKQFHEVWEMFVGKDYEWKIGDMDKVLNGNYDIASTPNLKLPFMN